MLLPSLKADTVQFGGLTFTITNSESDGSASVSNDGSTLTITGPNDGSGLSGTTDVTTTAPASGTVSFNWSFNSLDDAGYDAAGYLLAGAYTQLSANPGDTSSTQISVASGESFGFEVSSVDNSGEPGVFTISDFVVPQSTNATPEPASWLLLLCGIGALAFGLQGKRAIKHFGGL